MAPVVQKITLSSSRDIPFNKLVLSQSDLPPEKWTPGYAAFASACSGVMYPIAECRRSRL